MKKTDLSVFLKKTDEVADVLKELGHPARLRLLCFLIKQEKASVEDITKFCNISQSQTSQFLKRLREQNIINYKRDKNTYYYFIKDEKIKNIIKNLNNLYCK
jgi:DNA-binding transcriptional ArsR family regulator